MSAAIAIKERPILFSGPMVRAILEGRKTQTRRVMKPQPISNGKWSPTLNDFLCIDECYPPRAILWKGGWLGHDAGEEFSSPYGQVGDRLWVREAISDPYYLDVEARNFTGFYRATEPMRKVKWRPSIFMPRWASRIMLEITNVRVERLRDITTADIKAEGITVDPADETDAAHADWANGWNAINEKRGYSWLHNPWVWVIEFKKHTS